MKPEIKLFFDFEFTSLSPDAEPVSLGIASSLTKRVDPIGGISGYESKMVEIESKSFYAEFTDFDINRCDDWVKENVVGKLKYISSNYHKLDFKCDPLPEKEKNVFWSSENGNDLVLSKTSDIKNALKDWISQFSDYNIQFICDCGTFDWYWMLQLLAEWETKKYCAIKNTGLCQVKLGNIEKCPSKMYLNGWDGKEKFECQAMFDMRFGLPKLPENISPVPQDLNDLIALKKGISVREAFELNREELSVSKTLIVDKTNLTQDEIDIIARQYQEDGSYTSKLCTEIRHNLYVQLKQNFKHNSLFDAKVIKAIYEKLR